MRDEATPATRTAPSPSGRSRVAPLVLFLAAFAVFALTAARGTVSLDVFSANYASWHLTTAGTPWLDGEALPKQLARGPLQAIWVQEAANGHTVVTRSPGVVAAGLPAYWLLGEDQMTQLPGALTAALLAALAVLLMFLALRTRLSTRAALAASLVFAFATPVWSVAANGVWPHTVTVLGIAGMAWAGATGRWWLVGIFGGVTLWGRLHAAVIVAVLGLVLGWRRRDLRLVLATGVASAAFLLLLCVWTRWMYGDWNPLSSYGGGVLTETGQERLSPANQLGMWVSPGTGILVWTPVLVLLTPALVRSWQELPDWSRALLGGGLAYTVLQAVLITFTGGDSFYGYRLGLEFLACATPAFALSAARAGRVAAALLPPVLTLQCYAITVGSVGASYFIAEDRVWVDNGFLEALRETWPGGVVVGAILVCGALALRVARSRATGSRAVPTAPAG